MTKLEMADKLDQELRFVQALFTLIEYAAEDQASCDAISDVCHWMSGHIEDLSDLREKLAHALGLNLPENIEKLGHPHKTLSKGV